MKRSTVNRALAIASGLFVVLGLTATAAAQEDSTSPTPVPAQDGSVTLELIDQSFDLEPNGTIELRYRVIGDLVGAGIVPTTTTTTTTTPGAGTTPGDSSTTNTAQPPEPVPVVLTARILNYSTLDDPADLVGIIGPDPSLADLPPIIDGVDIVGIRSAITMASPTEAILDLAVPTDTGISVAERLDFSNDGIHPVTVELLVDDQVVASNGTVVERRSDDSTAPPTIDLSLFGATDDPGPDGSSAQYDEAIATFAGLLADASALETGLTLAIPPSVVTASVASGDLDAAGGPDLLDDDVILAAPATPFDVSSAVEVGRVDAFVRQLRVGEDEVAAAIGQTPSRDIWSTTSELSAPAAQTLRDLGVRYLAMPPDLYRTTIGGGLDADIPAIDRFIQLPLPDGGQIPVLVLDEELGAEFTEQATAEIMAAMTPTEWAIETIAELRLGQYAAPAEERLDERSHLIATPGLGPFDPTLIGELERISTGTDAIRFAPAADLTSATASVATESEPRLPDVAGPPLERRLSRIEEVSDELVHVASMLPPADPRPAQWVQLLDSLVSTSVDDATVEEELDRVLADAEQIRDGVVPPDPFTFTLTGREGAINVRVGNELSEPVDVVLRVSSSRLDFPDGDMAVTLAPQDVTVVSVPVVARSNGTSPVTVEILTPSLDPLTEPVTLTSRFTALTGLGPVLTGGLLLILLTWWFSHWRARRRAANQVDDADVPSTAEPGAE